MRSGSPGTLRAPRRAYEDVAAELEVLIRSGHYAVDERLPSERALANEFGVSRPTVRVALGQLEQRGLVATKANSGTFVTAQAVEASSVPALAEEDPEEVLETRLTLEVTVARLAARRAASAPAALEEVRLAVEAHERLADPGVLHPEIDLAFHRSVAAVTGNAFLCQVLEPLWRTIHHDLLRTLMRRTWNPEDTRRTGKEHRAIYEALVAGDQDRAAFAMELHLRGLIALIFEESPELPAI